MFRIPKKAEDFYIKIPVPIFAKVVGFVMLSYIILLQATENK
jgi:hypothetical protein